MIYPKDLSFDLPNFEYDRELLTEIADRYLTPEYTHIHRISAVEGRLNCLLMLNDLPEDFSDLPVVADLAELFSSVGSQSGGIQEVYEHLFFFNIIDALEFHIDNGEDYAADQNVRPYMAEGLTNAGISKIQGPHGPTGRSFAFNLPLRGTEDAPTVWLDKFGGEIMHEHYYTGPAMISTEHVHGSPDNVGQRLFLSMGGFYESLRDVKNLLIKEGKVF